MKLILAVLAAALVASAQASGGATCAGCSALIGLVGQLAGNGTPPSTWPWDKSPDAFCEEIKLCDGTCELWGAKWPVSSPDFPTDGKRDDTAPKPDSAADMLPAGAEHLTEMKAFRASAARAGATEPMPLLERTVAWLATHRDEIEAAGPGMFFGMSRAMARDSLTAAVDAFSGDANVTLPCDNLGNLTCDIHTLFDNHLPLADGDGDTFAAGDIPLLTTQLRGTSWRGRDCDDTRATVHPGRRTVAAGLGPDVDHNCNGISGTDPQTGASYEELFCSGPNAPMGVIGIGDSALAHFHIPPQYLNAMNFSLDHVINAASNELDWPQCSWSTGYRKTDECPASPVEMGSIYQRMRARNLCMHRDFTNAGVNGARVSSAAEVLIPNLKRDPVNDNPVLAFYALIGNDVCNGHPGLTRMTTPAEFRASVLKSFQELNNTLPPGSKVAVMGLVQGTILYDTMHNQTHPLGVDYTDLYTTLSCVGSNPCNGWLTSNDTLRALTQQRADNLTKVYDEIIAAYNHSYTFEVYRLDINWKALFAQYVQKYGNPRGAIEPVDGFHPSQATHQLLADVIWKDLEANRPHWIPPVNPNNAKIAALFGDQGGY
ncbi:hypothetical protein FNF29_01989 [Cafeteria roenbergensis]|uniref:SGNH hydrolase-type esterase domain-containing protein n=1 Tax=Cafeteria roenbergensis TaxID=33653 RepID=A0A5A8DE27_CAFRO|nr:hypothetical protein FNF29_01989 [Cafeteria roenbergensis]KAA0162837.1 hypothetical protein FNF31_03100 [Cafeteria roenbergensis]|eukprot:KAA0155238.1 hypothetical protein FNF29_01989 [Cafeteria roenbergensis]